jgi:hypothetical protein
VDLGTRVRWENDKLGRLLIFDLSNNSRDEAHALLDAFDAAVMAEAPGSVRMLVNIENTVYELGLTRRWREAVTRHDPQMAKTAMLGVGGGLKALVAAYRLYARFKGIDIDKKMALFDDEAGARAWLEAT